MPSTRVLIRQVITPLSLAYRLKHRPQILFSLIHGAAKALTCPQHAAIEDGVSGALINAYAGRSEGNKDASHLQGEKMGCEKNKPAPLVFKLV